MRSVAILAACAVAAFGALPLWRRRNRPPRPRPPRVTTPPLSGKDQGKLDPDEGCGEGAVGQA